jgi:hypothetical protein
MQRDHKNNIAVELHYNIQDRSAIPLREAYIRQFQFLESYGKMDAEHKKAFDKQAEDFLSRTFDDVILIHVNYGGADSRDLAQYWQSISDDKVRATVFLINDRGDHIPPVRFVSAKGGDLSFELYFPRMKTGEPIIQETDKAFSIEFQSPALGPRNTGAPNIEQNTQIPQMRAQRVLAEFKMDKMIWKGKPSF